jgi:hypothetical protein
MAMQDDFLLKACEAARTAGHVFPEYAACEAALESAWGMSRLAVEANNLFGQKQSHPPLGESLDLPTKEYLHGRGSGCPLRGRSFPTGPAALLHVWRCWSDSAKPTLHTQQRSLRKTGNHSYAWCRRGGRRIRTAG